MTLAILCVRMLLFPQNIIRKMADIYSKNYKTEISAVDSSLSRETFAVGGLILLHFQQGKDS